MQGRYAALLTAVLAAVLILDCRLEPVEMEEPAVRYLTPPAPGAGKVTLQEHLIGSYASTDATLGDDWEGESVVFTWKQPCQLIQGQTLALIDHLGMEVRLDNAYTGEDLAAVKGMFAPSVAFKELPCPIGPVIVTAEEYNRQSHPGLPNLPPTS